MSQLISRHRCHADPWRGRVWWGALTVVIAMVAGAPGVRADSGAMPAAPAGRVETGAPSFFVLGPESLGLSSAPTDLDILPDGRILVVSQHEIAIGDGVRWETFQEAPNQSGFINGQVAVDDDGRIYAGIRGAIARIDLGEDARWRFAPVVSIPVDDQPRNVVQFSDTWLWYSGSTNVTAWRPGQQVRNARISASVLSVFAVGNERYATSNGFFGSIFRLRFGEDSVRLPLAVGGIRDIVSCSLDYGPGQTVVGTLGNGIRTFDGSSFSDVPIPGILGPGHRINDLCRVGTDLYAAAVERMGIVFFDQGGRIVQVLDHTLDHRLARPRRLVCSPDGTLWSLLDNAVACLRFPTPISNFEPLLATGLNYAKPLRHQGGLWLFADGQLQRGVYDGDGCLRRFEEDAPQGNYIWSVAEIEDKLFACNERGIFLRGSSGWQPVAEGIPSARLDFGNAQSAGRYFYVANNEIGWIRESAGQYVTQRIPVPGLGAVFNVLDDPSGAVWLELGPGRVGRIDFGAGEPTVRFFGKQDGLDESWAGLFLLDGIVRCNTTSHLLRFDTPTQRFVEDRELIRRIPALAGSTGRPVRDPSGRLWFGARGSVFFVDDTKAGEHTAVGSLALGFQPDQFTVQTDGVIWMQGSQHLIRYDPRMPRTPPRPLRAQITAVQLAASNRHIFAPDPTLLPIPYSDNSLVMRFAAVSSPFGPPVSFEVMLEGATDRWVSTGNVGSASFNRLREGSYVFHVRPVAAAKRGEEARLEFVVQPPWFRSGTAWAVYAVATVSVLLFVAWFFSFMERRETVRLERLVGERTAELAASEERYRRLNAELEGRVDQRTAELSTANADLKREIAERQRVEEALREGEERFVSFMRNLPGLAFLKDHQRRILFVNESFEKCFGVPVAEWLGRTNDEIWPDEIGEKIRREDEAVLTLGQTRAIVEEMPTHGELRTYRTIRFPIPRPDGHPWLGGFAIDITELQRAEGEKEKLRAQLAQAQKMESVGRLAGGVAHDFNNMLQAILGNVALALEDIAPGSPVRENLEEIQKSAQHSAELTRQLLAFARKQTIQPKVLDLNSTISGMLKMVRRLIGEDIRLDWLPGAGLWPVKMDPSQIDQILVNLCVNARDAIAGVGELTIETSNVTPDDASARNYPERLSGDHVLLAVSDNGHGMDEATRANVFEPFFTTKDMGKGTGLGLATVFGIVVQNQGVISVDSRPGEGATFRIYLPRVKAEEGAPVQESHLRPKRGTETVLLVEDEEQVLNLSRRILESLGYTVLAAATPRAALALAEQHAGMLHLLITDVVMPGMNGMELRDQLHASRPGLKCLYLSGYTADVIAENDVIPEGIHFLQKPFTVDVFAETVRRVCEAD